MNRILGSAMLLLAMAAALPAQTAPVPEIGVSNGASALALLAGVVLVYQTRKKK